MGEDDFLRKMFSSVKFLLSHLVLWLSDYVPASKTRNLGFNFLLYIYFPINNTTSALAQPNKNANTITQYFTSHTNQSK